MQASQIPAKFTIPWANGAGSTYINTIPTASQIGVNAGFASLTDGFVPLNATPVASGGVPPRIQDWNGILNEVTAWLRWMQSGAPVAYDSTFQTAIGGYPNGALVQSVSTPGTYWLSTADNNTTNPDTGGAGWVRPFAALAGSASQAFNVANATTATEAVALGQLPAQFPNSLSSGGYQKLPGGMIIQWGSGSMSGGTGSQSQAVIFPLAFPNACFAVNVSAQGKTGATYYPSASTTGAPSKTGFTAVLDNLNSASWTNTVPYSWISIGY